LLISLSCSIPATLEKKLQMERCSSISSSAAEVCRNGLIQVLRHGTFRQTAHFSNCREQSRNGTPFPILSVGKKHLRARSTRFLIAASSRLLTDIISSGNAHRLPSPSSVFLVLLVIDTSDASITSLVTGFSASTSNESANHDAKRRSFNSLSE
jgi:hypothetical protein